MFLLFLADPIPESKLPQIKSKATIRNLKNKKVTERSSEKYGDIFPKTRALLDEFFEPYNKQLSELLNDSRFLWKENWIEIKADDDLFPDNADLPRLCKLI